MPSEIRTMGVVMPAHNEKSSIAESVRLAGEFAARNSGYKFLFVDDGSADGTAEIMKASIDGRAPGEVGFIAYPENSGKGYAVKTGFEAFLTGACPAGPEAPEALCFTDADLAYSLEYLPVLRQELREYDIVIGSRRLAPRRRWPYLRRRILGECFNRMARLLLGLHYRDTQSGLKAFRPEAARRIFEKSRVRGFCFDVEVLFLAKKFGLRVKEVPVTESDMHEYKIGKLKLMRTSVIMFWNLLLIRAADLRGLYD
jgi:glycosyltransferase involved in cell wall biosynthesis